MASDLPSSTTFALCRRTALVLALAFACSATNLWAERPEVVPLPPGPARAVSPDVMAQIYQQVKTPFKYGVILKGEDDERVDCPKVFRHDGRWFMTYTAIRDQIGYQTFLARSDDLVHWEKLGPILSFRREGWDAWQVNGGLALVDYAWNGTHQPGRYNGKYWMSYVGGARQGYETDPLSIGLAWTTTPGQPRPWYRYEDNPILASWQSDARTFESVTLYTSTIIHVDPELLGYPFVIFYNGKTEEHSHEAIGMAVSNDMRQWVRYGTQPVVDNAPGKPAISGNPQIVKIGDVWVMFYFGFRWQPGAFDTFACSYDLAHWTKWEGPNLVQPSEPFDKTFAHKPWVLKHDGTVYHFYCAVGDQGRAIALATSRDLRRAPSR